MGPSEILDFALHQVEGARFEQFQRMMAADPLLACKVERLAFVLERLLDDGLDGECRGWTSLPSLEEPCGLESAVRAGS
jgi:hypothetical protein